MKSLQEKFLEHFDVIEENGEKIVKFKVLKETENVATNKKRKRKSNSGNVK
jgi:hypothetical protein